MVATPSGPQPRRTCVSCDDTDPCWHGIPQGGWRVIAGLDVCPTCLWVIL